jgi:hypothetical protein
MPKSVTQSETHTHKKKIQMGNKTTAKLPAIRRDKKTKKKQTTVMCVIKRKKDLPSL